MASAAEIEEVIRGEDNPAHVLPGADRTCTHKLQWLWLTWMQPLTSRVLAILFGGTSVLIVLGELTLFTDTPVGLFPLLFQESYGELWTQVLCSLPLLYIAFCTYYSLFKLKLTGFYGLYRHNLTDGVHLLKSACMFCRLVSPLCLNYLLFIKVQGCQLSEVMGHLDLVPLLGSDFTKYFPSLLLVLCALNLGNCYSRFLEFLGIPQFKFSDGDENLSTLEGEALIRRGNYSSALLDTASSDSHSPNYKQDAELAELPSFSTSPKSRRTRSEIRRSLQRVYSPGA